MTVGLALIARDAEHTLGGLLSSIAGAFDQVVLVDTGSSSAATTDLFERWVKAERRRQPRFVSRIDTFAWVDDFAAARNHADSLLTTDWNSWADADDEIRGASRLRHIAASAPSGTVAFVAGYRYAENATGQAIAYVKRHRLARAGSAAWQGRVHEALVIRGGTLEIPPDVVEWVHRGDLTQRPAESAARNIALLERWLREEPDNPEVVRLLADARLGVGDELQALALYERYLASAPPWGAVRARVHRQIAVCLIALGRHEEALRYGREAVHAVPAWTESYLTLAEAYLNLGSPRAAIECAREVLRRGPPDTGLVIKPLDYSVRPRMLIASALRQAGDAQQSLAVAQQLLADCFGGP